MMRHVDDDEAIDLPEKVAFDGDKGRYELEFRKDRQTWVIARFTGAELAWPVEVRQVDAHGCLVLSGMTEGTEDLWKGVFWFELIVAETPLINFWDTGFIAWTDHGALK